MTQQEKFDHIYNMFQDISSSEFFDELLGHMLENNLITDKLHEQLVSRFEMETQLNSEDYK